MRSAGDGIERRGGQSRWRGEELQLGYLFPWPRWPLGCYGMSAGAGDWDKAMSERKEVTCDSLEMGAASWEHGCSWRSAAEMRIREGIGLGGAEGEVKCDYPTYFPSQSGL